MRVLNDKEEDRELQPELGPLSFAVHSILSCFGTASLLLGPLPMIFSHLRLPEPWPKLTAICGAVLALTVLDTPLPLVVVTFVCGLYVADAVKREMSFWPFLVSVALLAVGLGTGGLILLAQSSQTALHLVWFEQVDKLLLLMKENVGSSMVSDWEALRVMLRFQGPFLIVSTVLYSVWISLGLAAHLDWVAAGHPYSGMGLRKIRGNRWFNFGLGILLLAGWQTQSMTGQLLSGAFRLGSCVLFIQGCVLLSELFSRKKTPPWARTVGYVIAIVLGSYAVLAAGMAGPWFGSRMEKGKDAEEV